MWLCRTFGTLRAVVCACWCICQQPSLPQLCLRVIVLISCMCRGSCFAASLSTPAPLQIYLSLGGGASVFPLSARHPESSYVEPVRAFCRTWMCLLAVAALFECMSFSFSPQHTRVSAIMRRYCSETSR